MTIHEEERRALDPVMMSSVLFLLILRQVFFIQILMSVKHFVMMERVMDLEMSYFSALMIRNYTCPRG